MSSLRFTNSRGAWVVISTVAATKVKNEFGTILDKATRDGAVAITRHDTPRQCCFRTKSSSRWHRPALATWIVSAKSSTSYSKRCSAQRRKSHEGRFRRSTRGTWTQRRQCGGQKSRDPKVAQVARCLDDLIPTPAWRRLDVRASMSSSASTAPARAASAAVRFANSAPITTTRRSSARHVGPQPRPFPRGRQ